MGFSPCGATQPDVVFSRNRLLYASCMVLVVAVGLLWRSAWLSLPPAAGKHGGDALWSLMAFLGFGFLLPRSSTSVTAVLALAFSFTLAALLCDLWGRIAGIFGYRWLGWFLVMVSSGRLC